MYVSNNIGRIADRCEEIAGVHEKITQSGKSFSEMATGELQDCIEISRKLFDRAIRSVKDGDLDRARTVVKKKNKMRKAQKQLKRAHIARVNEGLCDASMTEDYSAIIYSLDRIVDNCVSIAEETLDHLSFVNFSEEEADEERPADIIAEIDAEETLEEHENKEPEESANDSDADGNSTTAINKATDFS